MSARRETTVFLLIEDDLDDVWLIRREIARAGGTIELHAVRDGMEGIRYLEGTHDYQNRHRFPLPDVILLDLKMPRFSGFDFLEWLQQKSPGNLRVIPVVVLSGSDEPYQVARAYALGANLYLVKPARWPQFAEVLQTLNRLWTSQAETPVIAEPEKKT